MLLNTSIVLIVLKDLTQQKLPLSPYLKLVGISIQCFYYLMCVNSVSFFFLSFLKLISVVIEMWEG